MGLAGERKYVVNGCLTLRSGSGFYADRLTDDLTRRAKISHDPNNTTWSRSTDNYGHKIMRSQGWTPGDYLGAANAAQAQNFTAGSASYVRTILKDDTLGLGAKPHSKKGEDEPTGLDAFQGLLGRLNGKSETDLETEQRKRGDVKLLGYVERRWKSMNFVKGGLLAQEKMPDSSAPKEVGGVQAESAGSQEEEESKKEKKKKRKKEKTRNASEERGELKDGAGASDEARTKEKLSRSKDKRDKKKKSKDRKADLSESEDTSGDTAKSKKRKRKERDKRKSREASADNSSSQLPETEEVPTPPTKATGGLVPSKESRLVGRQALRARSIRQKKASLMDDKSLNEVRDYSKRDQDTEADGSRYSWPDHDTLDPCNMLRSTFRDLPSWTVRLHTFYDFCFCLWVG